MPTDTGCADVVGKNVRINVNTTLGQKTPSMLLFFSPSYLDVPSPELRAKRFDVKAKLGTANKRCAVFYLSPSRTSRR